MPVVDARGPGRFTSQAMWDSRSTETQASAPGNSVAVSVWSAGSPMLGRDAALRRATRSLPHPVLDEAALALSHPRVAEMVERRSPGTLVHDHLGARSDVDCQR